MTITAVDTFSQTNGSALDSTRWKTLLESGTGYTSTITVQSNTLEIAQTSTTVGYFKASAVGKQVFSGGEMRGVATITAGKPNRIGFCVFGLNAYDAAYTSGHIDGLNLEITDGGNIRLYRTRGEQVTDLGTASTGNAGFGAGQVWRFAVRAVSGKVSAWVWRDNATRPTAPTIAVFDNWYLSGTVRLAQQAPDPGVTRHSALVWSGARRLGRSRPVDRPGQRRQRSSGRWNAVRRGAHRSAEQREHIFDPLHRDRPAGLAHTH